MPKFIRVQKALLDAQAGAKLDIIRVHRSMAQNISAVLLRVEGSDGTIPASAERALLAQVSQIISDTYTGRDNRQPFAADGVTPLAPYPRVLNFWLAKVVFDSVKAQETWLRNNIPQDVFLKLRAAKRPFVTNANTVAELADEPYPDLEGLTPLQYIQRKSLKPMRGVFEPNYQAKIDPTRQWVPIHRWNTPDGYRLSDRLWNTELAVRQDIDKLLVQSIRSGAGAKVTAQALEWALWPGERNVRTFEPYGKKYMPKNGIAFSAMRLARTEITRAFSSATQTAAMANPYVDGLDYCLSYQHPKFDICDGLATVGKGGDRLKEPYPVASSPIPPAHPNCICHTRPSVSKSPEQLTRELRAMLNATPPEEVNINPANAEAFTQELLGVNLFQQLIQGIIQMQLGMVFG